MFIASGYFSRYFFLLENECALLYVRLVVFNTHYDALVEAVLRAFPAVDAEEGIVGDLLLFFIDHNRPDRAEPLAVVTQIAVCHIPGQFSAHLGNGVLLLEGIFHRRGSAEKVL